MIDLEIPRKFRPLLTQARGMAEEVFWPISRKYDLAEHTYPAELDVMAALIDPRTSAVFRCHSDGNRGRRVQEASQIPRYAAGRPSARLSAALATTSRRRPSSKADHNSRARVEKVV